MVNNYLEEDSFERLLRLIIMAGGGLWMLFSCYHEIIYLVLNLKEGDAFLYERWAHGDIIPQLRSHDYASVVRGLMKPGESFYITYQAIIFYFLRGTVLSVLMINAFMAFWGSLVLVRLVYAFFIRPLKKEIFLPLFLVFTPSVVFWSSANLKEALIYWAICQTFAFLRPAENNRELFFNFVMLLVGASIGLLVRPHIAIIWIVGVFVVNIFQRKSWKYSLFLLLFAPLMLLQVNRVTKAFDVDLFNFKETKQLVVKVEKERNNILEDIEASRGGVSTFYSGKRGPIPVISGIKNTLLRPLIWRVKNMRSLLAALEIWTISLGICFLWMRMRPSEWKTILRNPAIRCALLVSIPFFFLFSYFPNEGLIARQRVQLYPALLALFAMPILLRKYPVNLRVKQTI